MSAKTSDNLKAQLLKWLEGQGYPLEMTVAQSFKESTFYVHQSEFYLDIESDKPRELDVLALEYGYDSAGKTEFELEISFCIQCKTTKDKPWLIFTSPKPQKGFWSPINSKSAEPYWRYVCKVAEPGKKRYALSTESQGLIGYGVTPAFTSGKDVAYEAIMGAIKAAISRGIQADRISRVDDGYIFGAVSFPVVVFDGLLFRCWLNDVGEIVVEETDSGVLYQTFPLPNQKRAIAVQIFSKTALDKLVKDACQIKQTLVQNIQGWLRITSKETT